MYYFDIKTNSYKFFLKQKPQQKREKNETLFLCCYAAICSKPETYVKNSSRGERVKEKFN